jgi:hypothetical protein
VESGHTTDSIYSTCVRRDAAEELPKPNPREGGLTSVMDDGRGHRDTSEWWPPLSAPERVEGSLSKHRQLSASSDALTHVPTAAHGAATGRREAALAL